MCQTKLCFECIISTYSLAVRKDSQVLIACRRQELLLVSGKKHTECGVGVGQMGMNLEAFLESLILNHFTLKASSAEHCHPPRSDGTALLSVALREMLSQLCVQL